jgi:single-stranded-DNA-specific exonuclease
MNFRWSLAPPQPSLAADLAQELRVSQLLAQCLLNRGLSGPEELRQFLEPRLKNLADPALLPNMSAAVNRLITARERAEAVVIFGDYDVDGVTSTALLVEVLQALGWTAHHYLPHRLAEGYGLSQDGVENCLAKFPATLLLAVDCGSNATDTISWLRQRGVDVIVLDHHQVSDPAPPAVALVNPQLQRAPGVLPAGADRPRQQDAGSLFCDLCSVGLAFKLAHALVKHGRQFGWPAALSFDLRRLLDLVALGTIGDLVPLRGENRILVSAGLARLRTTHRPGLQALKSVAQVTRDCGVYEVGFQLAPRLNAVGRLEGATAALSLLLARCPAEAEPLAWELDTRNRERQKIERGIAEEVLGALRGRFKADTDFVIVEGQMLWHIGVVGIVASRVLREFYRPTIILGGDATAWRGSGRSIEGFDLAAALGECRDLLLRHGGHAMAAGVSIQPENLDAFRERLNGLARRTLTAEQLQPVLRLDAEVSLAELTLERLGELEKLEPLGQGNPAVQLLAPGVRLPRPPQRIGREQQHLKFRVTDGVTQRDVVWWNCQDAVLPTGRFDLAFTPHRNEFDGVCNVQFKVLAWRPAQPRQNSKL